MTCQPVSDSATTLSDEWLMAQDKVRVGEIQLTKMRTAQVVELSMFYRIYSRT